VHVRDRGTLERLARFGVTTVLDMANPSPALVDSLRGVPGLTALRSAGTPALAPGCLHARMLVTDERAQIKRADQAGQFVADRVAEGSDYIKIVIGSPGADHDQATVDALVAAAHEHGKQAVAHASSYAAVAKAQQAGVDVLTHVPLDQALDEASVARMAADGRILIPTLTMMETLVSRLGLPAASYAAARASVAAAYRAGVPILAGTDANADAGSPAARQPRRQPAPRAGAAGGRRADQPRRVAGRDGAARALFRAAGPGRGRAGPPGRPGAHRRGPAAGHPGHHAAAPHLVRRDRA
jgi:hypothetical protein